MEAINIQKFRKIKSQIIEIARDLLDVQENEDINTNIELMQNYNNLIEQLTSYDLSKIGFEEWERMYLIVNNTSFDFSKTGANIDFSKIIYFSNDILPNLKGCNIKNFDFDRNQYDAEMFDKEFKQQNAQYFLSETIPQEVANRFYSGETKISDIKKYPEIKEKAKLKNIEYRFRNLYELIDKEEFSKLDEEFLETTGYIMWSEIITSINEPRTGEKIMQTLYDSAREKILDYNNIQNHKDKFYFNQNQLGSEFRRHNQDLILDENAPKELKDAYYGHYLTLKMFGENMQYFKDKKISHSFGQYHNESAMINMYGDKLYELYLKHGLLMNKVLSEVELPNEALNMHITDKKTQQIMKDVMSAYASNEIDNLQIIKMLMDYIPLEKINLGIYKDLKIEFINKYGIDNLIKLDNDTQGIFSRKDKYGQKLFSILAKRDFELNKDINKEDYEVLCDNMYNILRNIKTSKISNVISYDFIQGEFRKKYANIFISGDISTILKKKFYSGLMLPEDVKENPELVDILKDKDLVTTFQLDNLQEVLKIMKPELFLNLCHDYGKGISFDKIKFKNNMNEKQIRQEIEEIVYNRILEFGLAYDEGYPNSFKKKHPDLFLPEIVDEELRKKFYAGKLCYEDIRKNPQIKEIIKQKNLDVGMAEEKYEMSPLIYGYRELNHLWKDDRFTEDEILDLAEKYGEYLEDVETWRIFGDEPFSKKEKMLQDQIETMIMERQMPYSENVPEFFKEKHPDYFLASDAPEELKQRFYDSVDFRERLRRRTKKELEKNPQYGYLSFKILKQHPEWMKFLKDKRLIRALPREYELLATKLGEEKLLRLGLKYPEIVEKIVQIGNEQTLIEWYKATGEKFIPSYSILLNFPINEMDKFLKNSKKWSQLARMKEFNENEEAKTALLKASYTLGVFEGEDEGYTNVRKIFTEIPDFSVEKAHQIFDSFSMKYNSDFSKFFMENMQEIINDDENIKFISAIQRQFNEIKKLNSGRKLTLEKAVDYVKNVEFENIELGNEKLAELASKVGYSQSDYEAIQKLYNEGEMRDFSSIPHIQGEHKGYSYEMLRCDEPLALTVGTLTDCCQEIYGAGQSSMEHSVLSPDGRVFCVKDEEGRIVAQSWFWRNQYTGCFDNIEIPNRIFKMYEKEHPEMGRHGLTKEILEVYKKASADLMRVDKKVYEDLLKDEVITQEQYDSLALGRVTVGLGYNDIADAIHKDTELKKTEDTVMVRKTKRLPNIYTDAEEQYTLTERDGIKKSDYDNLYVYQDDIPLYDRTNISGTMLFTMKRMEENRKDKRLVYIDEPKNEDGSINSEELIHDIALEYEISPENTQILATPRIAIIFSNEDNSIKIADVLTVPVKEGLTEDQKQQYEKHIHNQIKKAVEQMNALGKYIDMSMLNNEQSELINKAFTEIQKDERSER